MNLSMQEQVQDEPENSSVSESLPLEDKKPSLETRGWYRLGLAYGRQVYRLRWFILMFWLIVLGVSIPALGSIGDVLKGNDYALNGSDSTKVSQLITNKLHHNNTQLLVIFQSTSQQVSNPIYQAEVNAFVGRAAAFPHVTSATAQGTGQDGRTTFVAIEFDTDSSFVKQHLTDFRKLLPVPSSINPARPYLTGNSVYDEQFTQISQQDIEYAEFAALPVALLVLLVVFGTLVAAAMPLLLALIAVPTALAVIYLIALHLSMSVFVLNVASIIGLGISIDYSLFMTRRFRDELAQGRSVQEAVAWMITTAGEAILFSGVTVMIGFIGLLLIGIPFMSSFGIGGAVVVSVALLAALTLLPALLGVLGNRINALHLPFLPRQTKKSLENGANGTNGQHERQIFWYPLAMFVMRRPVIIMLVVSVLLIGLGWPIFSMNIGQSSISSLPPGSEARQGLEILQKQFPQAGQNTISIIAQTPDGSSMLTAENLARLDHLTTWLGTRGHVTNVISLTKLPAIPGSPSLTASQLSTLYTSGAYQQNPELQQFVASTTAGDTTLITIESETKLDSAAGKALIDDLRAGDKAAGQGLTVLVGGAQAESLDFNRFLYSRFPLTMIFILLVTYVILLLMFRSLLLPLKAILMNVLSVSAAFGVLVFIFQWGNLGNILGFTTDGVIDSPIPALMFCILFGLSMDYEVFLLSRIREEWLLTSDNAWAVARGLEKTGGVITNAALLFVIVTGAFTFTRLLITKEMGLGMTVAVLVDATIIRLLLVPATMRVMGKWNWWLPFQRR